MWKVWKIAWKSSVRLRTSRRRLIVVDDDASVHAEGPTQIATHAMLDLLRVNVDDDHFPTNTSDDESEMMSHDLLERLFFLLPAGDVELALIGCESGKLQIVS